jgi:uncharacterized protein (TIGR03083 family)
MAKLDPWPIIHSERVALANDLEQLDDAQWSAQSLCPEWTVHRVLGHIVATAKTTPASFFTGLASNGFKFHVMNAKRSAAESAGAPSETLANFRAARAATTQPPGPAMAMVGEILVHGEDIRRPLGISHEYPMPALIAATEFHRSSNLLIGGKRRTANLRLRATDTDWSIGSGPEIAGPMLSIMLVTTGRRSAIAELSGDGLAPLAGRG